jgi:hypothetical protein
MRHFSAREQRLAALFLLLAAMGLVWLLVIHPIAAGFGDRAARRDLLVATYQRDERIIGQLPSLARAAAEQRRVAARFRLTATDEAGATAILVQRLTGAVNAAGGTLAGVESIAGQPGTVRARVNARLGPAQLNAFLGNVENGLPVLVVDGLVIDATTSTDEPGSGLLDVHLEVSAFFSVRPQAPSR